MIDDINIKNTTITANAAKYDNQRYRVSCICHYIELLMCWDNNYWRSVWFIVSYIIQDLTEEPNKYKNSVLEVESQAVKLHKFLLGHLLEVN